MKKVKMTILLSTLFFIILTQYCPISNAEIAAVILNHRSFVNSNNLYTVIGEVKNVGVNNLNLVKIVAVFYDKAGKIVDTNFTYTTIEIIKPGEKSPFQITTSHHPNKIEIYTVDISTYSFTTEQPNSPIQILSYSDYKDNLGYHHIVGEVQNNGVSNIRSVKIVATYYDSSNNVIATDLSYTILDIIQTNQKSPFKFTQQVDPQSYNLMIAGLNETNEIPYDSFQFFSNNSYIDSINHLHIEGEVKNTGLKNITFVEVIATYYDDYYNVVETDVTYTDSTNITTNQQSSFKIITENQVNKIDHYILQVQSKEHLFPFSLNCSVFSPTLQIGQEQKILGTLTPLLPKANITLSYTMPNNTIINRIIISNSDSKHYDTFQPSTSGLWSIRASWDGDSTHHSAISSLVFFTVTKIKTTLSCTIPVAEVNKGNTITISGYINPKISGKTITIIYKNKYTTITKKVVTQPDGSYNDSYTPEITGTWTIQASYDGDNTYQKSTSKTNIFTILEKTPNEDQSDQVMYIFPTEAILYLTSIFGLLITVIIYKKFSRTFS